MGNSISIRLVVGPADGGFDNKGNDDAGRGSSSARLQFITVDLGDIDFQPSGGPSQYGGAKGGGSNPLDTGDIDFRPTSGGSNGSYKPGQRNVSGTPDDGLNDFRDFVSFLSKLFGMPKQNDEQASEKLDGVSPSKRKTTPTADDPNPAPPPVQQRKRANNDGDPDADAPAKRQKVNNENDVKPSPSTTKSNTPVSASSPAGAVVPPHNGVEEVNKPIIVGPNEIFDGKNKLFKAGPGLNGGGTAETQEPVFVLAPGAQLKNVQFEGGDGVHLLGDAKLDNVHAVHGGPDDMVTIDGPGNKAHDAQLAGIPLSQIPNKPANVEITNSSFRHSHDKAIQVNGDANIKLKGIYAEDVGQLLVTRGGQPITAHVSIEDSNIVQLRSHLFRLDSRNSTLDIGTGVKTDNGMTQVMMGDPGKATGANKVVASTDPA